MDIADPEIGPPETNKGTVKYFSIHSCIVTIFSSYELHDWHLPLCRLIIFELQLDPVTLFYYQKSK